MIREFLSPGSARLAPSRCLPFWSDPIRPDRLSPLPELRSLLVSLIRNLGAERTVLRLQVPENISDGRAGRAAGAAPCAHSARPSGQPAQWASAPFGWCYLSYPIGSFPVGKYAFAMSSACSGALVLTREDVGAHALRRQGWSISAIARRLGRDHKTIRAYLNSERVPERRAQPPDAFVPFMDYCRQRLTDDPHLWASALFDEVCELGYEGTYSTFTRALRRHHVRPHCEPCRAATGRDVAVIAHPPGEEIQFDWLELPDPPATCWSARSRTRAAGRRCSRRPRTSRTWSRPSAGWCASSAAPPGAGDSTGWPPSATRPAAGCCRRSPRSRSTTTSASTSARRSAATARAWWKRPTTRRRNTGGARSRTR